MYASVIQNMGTQDKWWTDWYNYTSVTQFNQILSNSTLSKNAKTIKALINNAQLVRSYSSAFQSGGVNYLAYRLIYTLPNQGGYGEVTLLLELDDVGNLNYAEIS